MDLSVSKTPKEKRDRQPNWTEAEKQLLISLTRHHHLILENKGSDAITIKRKSNAWDDIATNMGAAGYHRTKDRLKQQLGRIRAAEAKRIKDALVKRLMTSNSAMQSAIDDHFKREESSVASPTVSIEKGTAQTGDVMQIKIEKASTLADFEYHKEQLVKSPNQDTGTSTDDPDLPNISTMEPENGPQGSGQMLVAPLKKKRKISFQNSGRAQRIRQLYLYRLAVERERLKNLRLQQRRDRVLFDNNSKIQNLKLQILRNLASQNNHINL